MKALYFGCARGIWGHRDAGHYWYEPGGRSVRSNMGDVATPFGYVDGKLAPRIYAGDNAPECPQGVAALHHRECWTALAFWDRTGDSRGNLIEHVRLRRDARLRRELRGLLADQLAWWAFRLNVFALRLDPDLTLTAPRRKRSSC